MPSVFLSQSRFQLMTLKDVCVKNGVFSGNTPRRQDYSDNSDHPEIIKVSSLKNGRVDFNYVGHIKPEIQGMKFVQDGDILMLSAAHQADYLGRNPCLVENLDPEKAVAFVAELMCLRVNREIVNPYYLLQLLMTGTYYRLVNRERRGQTSHIYPRDIWQIKIPVPCPADQEKSAEMYKRAYGIHRKHIEDAERILARSVVGFASKFMP